MKEFRGIFCALATPFTRDAEQVDQAGLRRLVDHMLANGVRGLITTGSTGECASMTMDERRTVLEVVLDQVRGRVPVLAHTAAVATREVVVLSRHAQQAGADGLMVVGPYYEPINEAEITAHYATVAKATDLPIMIYNHPGATGYSMRPECIAQLARSIDTVRLVKDTTGDVGRIHYLMELCGDSITVFNGADTLAFAGFAAGTVGAVWGAANATPRQCVDLFDAIVERNDLVRGRELWRPFFTINRFFEQEGYVASVKAATNMQGLEIGGPRPPILPLPAHKAAELGKLLEAVGLHGAMPVGAR